MLGQVATDAKHNEITAIPAVLRTVALTGRCDGLPADDLVAHEIAVTEVRRVGETVAREPRYALRCLPAADELIGQVVRVHWEIENRLH